MAEFLFAEVLEWKSWKITCKTVADLCRDWPNKHIFEYPFKELQIHALKFSITSKES